MKYEQALDQKGLKFEQLSNSLQKKINKIKEYDEKITEIKQTDDGSVTEEDIFSYNEGLIILDEEASKAILKFNIENYELQKERLIKTRKKIRKNDEPKEETENEVRQESKDEVKEQPKLENRIEELKKEVSIQPEKFVADEYDYEEGEEEIQEVVEDVDFDKKQNIKQKKGISTSLIIMGLGAFILTWGAVNFFKGRR